MIVPFAEYEDIVDPMNGEAFLKCPKTSLDELDAFRASLAKCSKSGLHNPLKNPERWVPSNQSMMLGFVLHSICLLLQFSSRDVVRANTKNRCRWAHGQGVQG